MTNYNPTAKYVDQEWHTVKTLREYAKELEDQNHRYANRAATYELAFEIIKKYPTTSYRLFALIHDLVCNKSYLAEDITEIILSATKTGE